MTDFRHGVFCRTRDYVEVELAVRGLVENFVPPDPNDEHGDIDFGKPPAIEHRADRRRGGDRRNDARVFQADTSEQEIDMQRCVVAWRAR